MILPLPEYLGDIGGLLTTFCYIPQIIRVFLLKSAKEVSLIFTLMLLEGGSLVIVWNLIAVVIVTTLLFAKLKYGR
jgi:uncharacterized protein with PQ loop repeat